MIVKVILAVTALAWAAPTRVAAQERFSAEFLGLVPSDLRAAFERVVVPTARTGSYLREQIERGRAGDNPEVFARKCKEV